MYSVVLMIAVTTGVDAPDFGRKNRCNGCNGGHVSCHGGGHYGGHGCHGGGHYGGHGCHGGHYTGHHGGCHGGHYGGHHGGGHGCHGGHYMGGHGCHGGHTSGYHGGHVSYGTSSPIFASAPRTTQATLIVELPAEAQLTIDGRTTTSTSSQRRFVSPPLDPNGNYSYTLQATVLRDGAPVTMTREVAIRPGQETRVRLELPATSVASGE